MKKFYKIIFVMKVRIPALKILVMWIIVFFAFAGIIFLVSFNLFLREWDFKQPLIISVYTVAMFAILAISLNNPCYEINKKDITEAKFGKKYTYFYSDIIYIDEEQSIKSKTLCFVTKQGHVKYLTFAKEGKIYDAAISKCKSLITREELERRFPGIKV